MRFGRNLVIVLTIAFVLGAGMIFLSKMTARSGGVVQSAKSQGDWIQVSSNSNHACGITNEGALYCWGDNRNGQLGDGTFNSAAEPVAVVGFSFDVAEVVTGSSHTCALLTFGELHCWGDNSFGQLGIGTTETLRVPALVSGLPGSVIKVAAGFVHSCAILDSGALYCWGNNIAGGLGDGSTDLKRSPVPVSRLSNGVAQVAAGALHTCALIESGAVYCWGNNANGEIGDGTDLRRPSPTAVSGFSNNVAQVTARDARSCAVTVSGEIRCWGQSAQSDRPIRTPVSVARLSDAAKMLSVSDGHACAVLESGRLQCWGTNEKGQLGDGTRLDQPNPTTVSGLEAEAAEVAVGIRHTCARLRVGEIYCWGDNTYGQLGDGTNQDRILPTVAVAVPMP